MTALSVVKSRAGSSRPVLPVAMLLLLLLAGLWLRLAYLKTGVYFTDEFISMLAAKMVARQGWPVLPSGLFYDHGLLFTLVAGAFVALLGFSEEVARWPVILVSVLTIAVYYRAARNLFNSRLTGLLAAALITFDVIAIKWGVWARSYTQTHLFILLVLAWLLTSTLKQPRPGPRYLLLAFLAAALFSHNLTLFALPPLAILLLAFTLTFRKNWLYQPGLWQQAGLALLILTAVFAVVSRGQVGSTVSLQDSNAAMPPPFGLEFLRGFFRVGVEWPRFRSLIKFFREPYYPWLAGLAAIFLLPVAIRLWRRKFTFADIAFLFIALYPLLVILEMAVLLTPDWQKSVYMFFLTLPALILLAAESLARLLRWLARHFAPFPALPAVAGVGLVVAVWGPLAWDTVHGQTTGSYNTAFVFVRDQMQPGDKVMTEHPAAAYLYLDQNDYYANQVTAKVLPDEENENAPIDRYTGSLLIDTPDALNALLSTGNPLWFVVGTAHLNKYYDPLFHAQIFAQMELVRRFGETYIFKSRPYAMPVPAGPTTPLNGNFGDFIRLEGYCLNPQALLPNGTTLLGLYWRPAGDLPPTPKKVFVQLRNGQNTTISQADHFIFQGMLTPRRWKKLQQENSWAIDSAYLPLDMPRPASEGPYRIFIGLYDPDTFERVPLLNDASGENAVIINLPD